jgi:hypothetical protein
MPKSNNRGRGRTGDFGVIEMARERPFAAAAAAAGAAAAGLFLWSKRAQISDQLTNLSDQIGEWKQNRTLSDASGDFAAGDDTGGLATSAQSTRSTSARRRSSSRRAASVTGGGQIQETPTA